MIYTIPKTIKYSSGRGLNRGNNYIRISILNKTLLLECNKYDPSTSKRYLETLEMDIPQFIEYQKKLRRMGHIIRTGLTKVRYTLGGTNIIISK